MKREIKFRVWDKEQNRYLANDEIHGIGGFYYNGNMEECEQTGECDEYILMQYTGLKDKNGKEIYESDYLGDWCVFWGSGQYILQNISTGDIMMCNEISIEGKKVTGNRYENPREHKAVASDL